MACHKLMVFSNPRDDRHDDFNRWYDQVHIPDVLKVPGVVSAERFRLQGDGSWAYMAIYSLDCDDPKAVTSELLSRAATDAMPLSDAFDTDGFYMDVATPIASTAKPPAA